MSRTTDWRVAMIAALVCMGAGAGTASANLYLNEIFWDAGGSSEGPGHLAGNDFRDEFVELRGTPGMSLANHYLIFLENENNATNTGRAGEIDNIFDFNIACGGGPCSMGTSGFLTIRQKDNLYNTIYGGVATGTTDLVNTGTGTGFGNGASSSIGHTAETGKFNIENGGWTAMLIRNDGDPVAHRPYIFQDLDVGNNGLDSIETAVNGWRANWTILDSLGVHAEGFEAFYGRTYAQVNFGTILPGEELAPGFVFTPNLEPGAVYVGVPWSTTEREIEYVARWGNSTGQTPDDWHVVNVTQRSVAGSAGGAPDYRVSGEPHPSNPGDPPPSGQVLESTKGVPYGTPMMNTLGAPNYGYVPEGPLLPGDYNSDNVVDAADYTVWRNSLGMSITLPNEDDTPNEVTIEDYAVWKLNYGNVLEGAGGLAFAVPEPGCVALLTLSLTMVALRQRHR